MTRRELRIGEWTLHVQLNELRGPTGPMRLEPRTCAVLVALADRAGEVCGRDELLDTVWGDAFVGEAVLTHSIWELRRAFGDDAKKPRYIQTVPRRGYRLLAPVDEVAAGQPVLRALLISELVDRERLVRRLGDLDTGRLDARLDQRIRELITEHGGREIDRSAGSFLLVFERPIQAVRFAHAWHAALGAFASEVEVAARLAIHLGELELVEAPVAGEGERPLQVEGVASRVMALARGGQTLLTRGAFDLARRASDATVGEVEGERWVAHGSYLLNELEGPVEIFEVGIEGQSPFEPPPDTLAARRILGDGIIVGWRPAPGQTVPQRPNWRLVRKLGEGGFGEVWLTEHLKTGEPRVFKFCYELERLRALMREVTLFRLLKETLGTRRDIARLLDWNFDQAPYFLEMEHSPDGSMVEWAEEQGGLTGVPLAVRLRLLAQTAEALAAAHSVGVLHKDVKPANILVRRDDGEPRACLTDFGIGRLTDQKRLEAAGVTALGLTRTRHGEPSETTSGTRLYTAPEVLEGKAASIQADIYALGVVLYQLVVGDFSRALAQGWRREIDDELLAEDIAACVDGAPEHRLASAGELAQRLSHLEQRRAEREAERRAREQAEADRRALKRVRRRRKLLAWATALALVVLAIVSVLALQAARARRAAEEHRDRSEGLVGFMLGDLRDTLHSVGRLDAMASTADRVLRYYASFDEAEMTDEALQRRVMALHQIGEVWMELGDLEAARAVFDQAAQLAEGLVAHRPDAADRRAVLADSRFWLGSVALQSGDLGRALDAFEAHREQYAALVAEGGATRTHRLELAYGLSNVGHVLEQLGRTDEALAILQQALAELERLAAEHPDDLDLRRELASSHQQVGAVLEDLGRLEAALASYRSDLEILRRLEAKTTVDAPLRERLAAAEAYVGRTLFRLGDVDGALEHYRQEVDASTALSELDPENARWQRHLAVARGRLGAALRWRGETEAARRQITSAREVLQGLVEKHPGQAGWRRDLALQHRLLATLPGDRWRGERVVEARRAVEILEALVAERPDDRFAATQLGESHGLLAEALEAAGGSATEIGAARRRAVEILEPVARDSRDPGILAPWALALLARGSLEEARPVVERLFAQGYREPAFVAAAGRRGLVP